MILMYYSGRAHVVTRNTTHISCTSTSFRSSLALKLFSGPLLSDTPLDPSIIYTHSFQTRNEPEPQNLRNWVTIHGLPGCQACQLVLMHQPSPLYQYVLCIFDKFALTCTAEVLSSSPHQIPTGIDNMLQETEPSGFSQVSSSLFEKYFII